MSQHIRKHVWWDRWGGLLVVGSLLGGGCTAGSPPVALEQARTAYAQAEQTPAVVANAPVPLRRRTKPSGGRSACGLTTTTLRKCNTSLPLPPNGSTLPGRRRRKKWPRRRSSRPRRNVTRSSLTRGPVKPSGPTEARRPTAGPSGHQPGAAVTTGTGRSPGQADGPGLGTHPG